MNADAAARRLIITRAQNVAATFEGRNKTWRDLRAPQKPLEQPYMQAFITPSKSTHHNSQLIAFSLS